VQELRRHRLRVTFVDASQRQHGGAVAGEGLPEFPFDFGFAFHGVLLASA
jgi:hypothetical protein